MKINVGVLIVLAIFLLPSCGDSHLGNSSLDNPVGQPSARNEPQAAAEFSTFAGQQTASKNFVFNTSGSESTASKNYQMGIQQ